MTKAFGIGFVGLGVMGTRVAQAMREDGRFTLVGAFDPELPSDAPMPLLHDLKAVVGHPDVDCVYIASPPHYHQEAVELTTKAGKPIFCEKPLASTVTSAHACVEAVRRSGVPAAVNFPMATAAAAQRLADLLRQGQLGSLESAELKVRFSSWPRGWQHAAGGWLAESVGGGFTREVASHFVFLANRLFGTGKLASAKVERGMAGTETRILAHLKHPKIDFVIDGAVEGEDEDFNCFDVIGQSGRAVISDWYRLDYPGGSVDRIHPMPSQLDGLVRMLSRESHELASFQEAAAVVEVIEGILGVSARP